MNNIVLLKHYPYKIEGSEDSITLLEFSNGWYKYKRRFINREGLFRDSIMEIYASSNEDFIKKKKLIVEKIEWEQVKLF